MPKIVELPDGVKPYIWHGVLLEDRGENWVGDCPFCGGEGKFSALAESGLARCWSCVIDEDSDKPGVNHHSFLKAIWERSKDEATEEEYRQLREMKKLINTSTLKEWGFVKSFLTGEWIVPGYNPQGKLIQLYRYIKDYHSGKYRLMPTPGIRKGSREGNEEDTRHGIMGMQHYKTDAKSIYLCEGVFDAMALWETLGFTKVGIDEQDNSVEVSFTSSESQSVLSDSCVLAIPSCNVFYPFWSSLFAGKSTYILFDNDYPKKDKNTGNTQEPAAYAGAKRCAKILLESESPPFLINYLSWHPAGENYNPALPAGYDVRDLLSEGSSYDSRIDQFVKLLESLRQVPNNWREGVTLREVSAERDCLPCDNWEKLENAWKKAMKWIDGLGVFLSTALAAVASTKAMGDQLWVKGVGPASCGKSEICDAILTNKRYTELISNITSLYSGYRSDKEGKEDNSLAATIKDKTAVIKDGDVFLQLGPIRAKVMAQLRDLYDKSAKSHFGIKAMNREYTGHCVTMILCGTESLRELDSSELGERYLDCVIVDEIPRDLEREIAIRRAWRAARDTKYECDGKIETRDSPEMILAKRLTGGYVGYLRRNAAKLLGEVEESEEVIHRIVDLAEFVSFMRARPSKKQQEKVQKELCIRLSSQLTKLAKCLAVVLNKRSIDSEVMRRVKKIALDTGRGRTLSICRVLHKMGNRGNTVNGIAAATVQKTEEEIGYLVFLRKIKVLESFRPESQGIKGEVHWRMTPSFAHLYREVTENP